MRTKRMACLVAVLAFSTFPLAAIAQDARDAAEELSTAFAEVAEQASPAVVFIEVEMTAPEGQMDLGQGPGGMGGLQDLLEEFFGQQMPDLGQGPRQGPRQRPRMPRPRGYGQGSGFIISQDGYIVTNSHVVGEADKVRVTLSDGREFPAEVVGTDPQTEVALVRIDAQGLPTVPLGDSNDLRVGQWVMAIGSPFGLSNSASAGIVSARGRGNVRIGVDYADFIQTDAAINPGNSGGPLLNLDGEVVGVNTAILSQTGGYMGIGFAIPINMVKYVEKQLRETGTVERGFIGIGIQSLTPDLAKWFGIEQGRGVLVTGVSEDSPAAKAGLQRDDVIVEMNGDAVRDAGTFRSRVASTSPGTEIELGIIRDGERMTQSVTLGTLPQEAAQVVRPRAGAQVPLGLTVQELTPEMAENLGQENDEGVVISQVQPGSSAAEAGLQRGMIILEVNRQRVNTVEEFRSALEENDRPNVLLLVRQDDFERYVTVETADE